MRQFIFHIYDIQKNNKSQACGWPAIRAGKKWQRKYEREESDGGINTSRQFAVLVFFALDAIHIGKNGWRWKRHKHVFSLIYYNLV